MCVVYFIYYYVIKYNFNNNKILLVDGDHICSGGWVDVHTLYYNINNNILLLNKIIIDSS